MHGVQAQSIHVVIPQPHQRIVDQEPAHLGSASLFEIDRSAPGCGVVAGEIRTKLFQVIAHRSKVVVDHIQQHGEPFAMAFIHETFEVAGLPVGIERRVQIHTVIAPSTLPREICDGHQLNVRHSQIF